MSEKTICRAAQLYNKRRKSLYARKGKQAFSIAKKMEEEAITLENIRKILLNFTELFDIMEEDEQKNLLTYLVKEIQLNPNWESKSPLKYIEFNFPIYRNGEEVRKFMCESDSNVETLVVLTRKGEEGDGAGRREVFGNV